jgi:hypothetical protein
MNYTPINTTYYVYTYNSKGNCLIETWDICKALAVYADAIENKVSDKIILFRQDPATNNRSEIFAEYRN